MTSEKPNAGSVQEWYALSVNPFRKAGVEPPAWDELGRKEVRAWMLAFASQVESTTRVLDAIELTFPNLSEQLEAAARNSDMPSDLR